jgi:hypothetical protein
MIASTNGNPESPYDMHVIVTGSEKIRGADCWRLEFVPIAAARTKLGIGHQVLLDKTSGTPLRITVRHEPLDPDTPPLEKPLQWISPLPGFPTEVLPLVGTPPWRSRAGDMDLEVTAEREKGYT